MSEVNCPLDGQSRVSAALDARLLRIHDDRGVRALPHDGTAFEVASSFRRTGSAGRGSGGDPGGGMGRARSGLRRGGNCRAGGATPQRRHFDIESLKWQRKPAPLELLCHGPQYDGGVAESAGHFSADLGFEHSFTGHGGLLAPGSAANPFDSSDHPIERTFRRWMSTPGNRAEYHARTRENIQLLMAWLDAIARALPVKRSELWSEGEENFEARVDAILAQH